MLTPDRAFSEESAMANMKSGVPNGKVTGDSRWYPQVPGFKATFWGNGWNSSEEKQGSGKMEKNGGKMSGKMMSRPQKCSSCGG